MQTGGNAGSGVGVGIAPKIDPGLGVYCNLIDKIAPNNEIAFSNALFRDWIGGCVKETFPGLAIASDLPQPVGRPLQNSLSIRRFPGGDKFIRKLAERLQDGEPSFPGRSLAPIPNVVLQNRKSVRLHHRHFHGAAENSFLHQGPNRFLTNAKRVDRSFTIATFNHTDFLWAQTNRVSRRAVYIITVRYSAVWIQARREFGKQIRVGSHRDRDGVGDPALQKCLATRNTRRGPELDRARTMISLAPARRAEFAESVVFARQPLEIKKQVLLLFPGPAVAYGEGSGVGQRGIIEQVLHSGRSKYQIRGQHVCRCRQETATGGVQFWLDQLVEIGLSRLLRFCLFGVTEQRRRQGRIRGVWRFAPANGGAPQMKVRWGKGVIPPGYIACGFLFGGIERFASKQQLASRAAEPGSGQAVQTIERHTRNSNQEDGSDPVTRGHPLSKTKALQSDNS